VCAVKQQQQMLLPLIILASWQHVQHNSVASAGISMACQKKKSSRLQAAGCHLPCCVLCRCMGRKQGLCWPPTSTDQASLGTRQSCLTQRQRAGTSAGHSSGWGSTQTLRYGNLLRMQHCVIMHPNGAVLKRLLSTSAGTQAAKRLRHAMHCRVAPTTCKSLYQSVNFAS
jgi:hypothetical protein